MFRSLKDKLKIFRKKAAKELQDEQGGEPGSEAKPAAGDSYGDSIKMSDRPSHGHGHDQVQLMDDKPGTKVKQKEKTSAKPQKKEKPVAKSKLQRKRSRSRAHLASSKIKHQIEKETEDSSPWEKIESSPLPKAAASSWFTKSISESKLENILWDLEMALLESDVALPVVEEIKAHIKSELLEQKFKSGTDIGDVIEGALKNAVISVLQSEIIHFDNFIETSKKPVKLMFVGVNGTGKTSAIAKLVFRLKKQKRSCVVAASDTFRAGAIEQLEKHATKLGVKLIKDKAGSDPAAIAFDAIEHAKARHKEIVLIDTAGRMQTNQNLMDEMRKIKRVTNPDMIIFVGDSLTGNDVVEQAKHFDSVVGIDAAILTKIDADAKGGAALSIAQAINKPILFVSVGQRYGDILPFNPKWLVNRIFE